MKLNTPSTKYNLEGYPRKLVSLKGELQCELETLLKFWSNQALDLENGGVIGRIDHYGNRYDTAPKGCVLTTRLLWTFSAAYKTTLNPAFKVKADAIFAYLLEHFWDYQYGGLFWEVDFKGIPTNKRKQAYAQGFGIYAFSEYYSATNNSLSLKYAVTLFNLLEEKFKDQKHSGYIEALQNDWSHIEDMRLSEKELNVPKTMNTHLHIIEPYTNLYRVWKDETLKKSIANLLFIFQDKIIDKATGHFNLFFDIDWQVRSQSVSFGHDIEGAWLLNEAAEVLEDQSLIDSIRQSALKLANNTMVHGRDKDGAVFNGIENDILDKDKHWWPQAEAMVGFMDAFAIDPRLEYLDAVINLWIFIKGKLIDRENGEWFWRVDEHGHPNPNDDKLGLWKCPYHNSRALIELIKRIDQTNQLTLCKTP
ncbi:AGE family epimerase/isomerase [Robertkochia flava]|uniref:AGE family epimerase/isomerase n=1 Tax=Robertkochia flava TaxID=3447986 RepID=UPI001CCEF598|nr:AGE family epimerase/isomerase [Robertkochia marina]